MCDRFSYQHKEAFAIESNLIDWELSAIAEAVKALKAVKEDPEMPATGILPTGGAFLSMIYRVSDDGRNGVFVRDKRSQLELLGIEVKGEGFAGKACVLIAACSHERAQLALNCGELN